LFIDALQEAFDRHDAVVQVYACYQVTLTINCFLIHFLTFEMEYVNYLLILCIVMYLKCRN
jgi:hypothetical protein